MKKTRITFLWSFLVATGLLLLQFGNINAQSRASKINEHVAVFYPDNFNVNKQLPSFMLLAEPIETGDLPEGWRVKVNFGNQFGKSMALIDVGADVNLYGTGEATGTLLKNGYSRQLWNTDNYTYQIDNGSRLYQSHPWVLGVRKNGTSFGILADNTWKQEISLGEEVLFSSDGPPFRVFVIEAETPQKVIQILADLTGKMKLPPLWSLGYQQCRYSYCPDSRVKEIADTFRLKQIPCDVIWMDIDYMQDYKVFTFDSLRFPDPAALNNYLHKLDFKSVYMIDPGIKKEPGYFVYDSGTEQNAWVKTAGGEDFVGKVWPGDCVFPDFTSEKVQKWWTGLYPDFMKKGVDGVWNDMNEPSVFNGTNGTMPENNIHQGGVEHPKDLHLRYHNVYGLMMVKASLDGLLNANPGKRPFLLTRSNFIGGQRYAATWTGDNRASWNHMRMSIPMTLNLGLSGQPFNGPDIGGFAEEASPELFGQWIAVGAFFPFVRAHTMKNTGNQEPWAFGKEIEDVSRTALQRRYKLLPYLYTLFQESSVNGMPVMRPVFFADLNDIKLRAEDQAFLLGSNLLVVPKWADKPALPKGIWETIDLLGENSAQSKYHAVLKQRGGSIIPLGGIIQSTNEYSTDSLTLLVCLDKNMKAEGTLYNDAGNGFGYQKGEYSIDNFSAQKLGNKIIVTGEKAEGEIASKQSYYRIGFVTGSGIVYSEWKHSSRVEMAWPEK